MLLKKKAYVKLEIYYLNLYKLEVKKITKLTQVTNNMKRYISQSFLQAFSKSYPKLFIPPSLLDLPSRPFTNNTHI